jgi:cytochrome c peroxidase
MASLDAVPRSPHRADDGALTEAAERGRRLFEDPSRGCVDCHPAPAYTDSAFVDDGEGGLAPQLHDVGTLDATSGQRLGDGPLWGIDTPTLRGTGVTGPWGHRGQAATVWDLFPAGDTHGITSDLTAGQRSELEAFLLQLE